MQVLTYMTPVASPDHSESSAAESPTSTRSRILAGAAQVFARDGIEGATTREIARVAGVNEVTLFRHFKTKDNLLAAVVGENFGPAAAAYQMDPIKVTDDLRNDLVEIAKSFDKLITSNLPLVRTMLGELQRYQAHECQVVKGLFFPLKTALHHRLASAHAAGQLKPATSLDILADLFVAMVFMGVLRRNMPHIRRNYSNIAYLQGIVDTVLQGALVSPAKT
ncbi:MAG TPA: TetR/AcrR family transcriptional regulator [Opitutaceae bacterium]|nr:TetR/AcrR family transcriptional regulator [Opitutaceae bacterium]